MRLRYTLTIFFLLLPISALAQATPAVNSPKMAYNYSYTSSGVHFAQLNTACGGGSKSPTPPNCAPQIPGSQVYCIDCQQTTNCTSGGSGAWAVLQGAGGWGCNVNGVNQINNASLLNITGAVQITGNSGNGSDFLQAVCVNGVCPVTAWGAIPDAFVESSINGPGGTCTINSGSHNLNCTDNPFSAGITAEIAAGKTVNIYVAGAGGSATTTLVTTIASRQSASAVTLTAAATSNASSVNAAWGVDNTTAIQNAFNAIQGLQYSLYFPSKGPNPNFPSTGGYLHHGLNFTGSTGNYANRMFGDGPVSSVLRAINVPAIGGHTSVGVDVSGNSFNVMDNMGMTNGNEGMPDMAATINVMACRSGVAPNANFAIVHDFTNDFIASFGGTRNLWLFGYEQIDLSNSILNLVEPSASSSVDMTISTANTPSFSSPYVTCVTPPSSMTVVNVQGGGAQFAIANGIGIQIDEGTNASQDIWFHNIFMSLVHSTGFTDTCTGSCNTPNNGLKDMQFDQIDVEPADLNDQIFNITAPALGWHLTGNSYYGGGQPTVIPLNFTNQFVSGYVNWDATGVASGANFSASNCAGSTILLGGQGTAVNSGCADAAILGNAFGTISYGGLVCVQAASVSGGGTLQTGSNGFVGQISNIASTNNVITIGCTCPNAVTGTIWDITSGAAVTATANTATAITFSGTSGHAVNYSLGCR